MIGKITIGKSFNGCIRYCLNDKQSDITQEKVMKNRAEVVLFNQCYGNERELIQQFNEVRQLNSKLSKPVLHITLSLAPGEQLSKDKLMEMCQDCARDIGFENNQYIAVHHRDTNHQHIHIVANRVGFDKRTVSDSKNFQKIASYCRKMELKYQLKQVLSPRVFLLKEHRQIPRQDIRKELLKKDIKQTLQLVNNYHQFEQKMEALGYQVLKGRGISFIDKKKVKIKGSEVGFSLMKIEKILALKPAFETNKNIEKLKQGGLQNKQSEGFKKPLSFTEKWMIEKQEQVAIIRLQKQIGELIYEIIKPEHIPDQLAPEWLKKKRERKRRRPLF